MTTCPKCSEPCREKEIEAGECIWCVAAGKAERRKVIASTPRALVGPARWGGTMFVHHDPQEPMKWRVSYLKGEEAIGHFGPADFEACIEDCRYNGDTDLLKAFEAKDAV